MDKLVADKTEFKPSPLGAIPMDWKIMKGEEIAIKVTKGSSPKWQGFQYQSEGLLFVTSENVRDGFLDVSEPKFLPIDFNRVQQSSILKRGDILINLVGASIGRSCIYNIDTLANINQAVCILRLKKDVLNTFVANYLSLRSSVERMLNTKSASAQPNLTLEDIRDFPVPIPPYQEQEAIANLLNTWDKTIEKTTQLIIAKEQRKKWLMQQLLTGKKRLKGFEDDWTTKFTSDFADITMGQSPDGNTYNQEGRGVPLINGPTEFTEKHPVKVQWTTSPTKMCKPDDILLCIRGSSTGRLNIADEAYCIGRGIAAIRAKAKMSHSFLQFLIHRVVDEILSLTTGSTFPNVDSKSLKGIEVHIPPYQEQIAIAKILEAADKEINLFKQKLEAYKEQKKGLMQVLLTGKVRLKNGNNV